jgi:hypothetical protein
MLDRVASEGFKRAADLEPALNVVSSNQLRPLQRAGDEHFATTPNFAAAQFERVAVAAELEEAIVGKIDQRDPSLHQQ